MEIKCRGHVGKLVYLSRCSRIRHISGRMIDLYYVELELNKNDKICLANVTDNEIKVLKEFDFQETPES